MLEILFLVALLVTLTWSAWIDAVWIAGVAVLVFGALTWLFGTPANFAWLADPVTFVSIVVVSLGIGALWSMWKWRRHVKSEYVQSLLKANLETFKIDEGHRKERFGDGYRPTKFMDSTAFPGEATASYNKQRIMTWIMLWPFSMVVYFFEDFLADIARWIYERLVKVYQRITMSALTDEMK